MSLSLKNKFIITAALVLAGAAASSSRADAAELNFQDKKWDVTGTASSNGKPTMVSGYMVRNDFKLADIAKQSFAGTSYQITSQAITPETSTQLIQLSSEINQPAKNATLVIDETGRWAKEFEPGQNGQGVDLYKTYKLLVAGQTQIDLPVLVSKPSNSLDQTNTLGINELVSVGESDFSGSPHNRRVNIDVGASRFQGLIIKPGEEFSFNEYLGDVDGAHGFLPELVIKKTGTVPEFGGGLCQVSSTAFRAAMNAGLPITARRNHSYAVKYYAPQGTDATIYPGVQDFKFINDLSSALLIRTRVEGNKLYYDFYGTKDNRQITFDGPYQFDKKTDGSMKAIWTRDVIYPTGEKKEQVFNSTYQPPALFHNEVQASTPNPDSNNATPQPTVTPTPVDGPTPTPTPTSA